MRYCIQDLLDRIKGLQAACACLERERGESLRVAGDLEKDVAGLKSDLETACAAAEGMREEVQRKERQRAQVVFHAKFGEAGVLVDRPKEEAIRLRRNAKSQAAFISVCHRDETLFLDCCDVIWAARVKHFSPSPDEGRNVCGCLNPIGCGMMCFLRHDWPAGRGYSRIGRASSPPPSFSVCSSAVVLIA